MTLSDTLTGEIWPAHPKPFADEILSSWIVRVAQANGIKLQTLCWMLFGNDRSPWNRDIDRSAPSWLLKAFCRHTGTNYWDAYHATLTTYRSRLYSKRRKSGQMPWILPINSYGMKHQGYGIQFCPECLTSDSTPYFRKGWRLAIFTYCPLHQIRLHDACPACGEPIAYHRHDFGRDVGDAAEIHECYACRFDLRLAQRKKARFPSSGIHALYDATLKSLTVIEHTEHRFDARFFTVLHQLCRIMESRANAGRLYRFISEQIKQPDDNFMPNSMPIEQLRLDDRHNLIVRGLWVLSAPETNLHLARIAKAVRYSQLLKDIDSPAAWFAASVKSIFNRPAR